MWDFVLRQREGVTLPRRSTLSARLVGRVMRDVRSNQEWVSRTKGDENKDKEMAVDKLEEKGIGAGVEVYYLGIFMI